MRRRALLAFLLAAVRPAQAQGRVYRLGVLSVSQNSIDTVREWTLPELAREGFVEGRNLVLDGRSVEGVAERLPALARELVATRPDVVIAVSNPAAHALRAADPTMAIVMGFAGNDPVADGLAVSVAQPGGRVTGVVMLAEELDVKRVEFARELLPRLRRVGFLAGSTITEPRLAAVEQAARVLGVELVVARAGSVETFGAAFATFTGAGVDVVVVASFPGFSGNATTLAGLAAAARLPTVCEWREMAEAGCLVGYGPSLMVLRQRLAFYVARIFRGESPGTLAMERAARFELVINLRTARNLDVAIPPVLLARADAVIE
jgi:putative ABC transport system substrate-binding protein